jgi:flagellar basal-body rod modification protein FlgD
MTTTNGVSGASPKNDYPEHLTTPASGKTKTARDDFMTLFIAQLENQSPLNPQDGSEFIAQLATLSQVEQAAKTNETLSQLASLQFAATQASYMTLVGKEVTASPETIGFPLGDGTKLSFATESAATNVTITVKDSTGKVVRTIEAGARTKGTHSIVPDLWDGGGLSRGEYTVEVAARNRNDEPIGSKLSLSGRVASMRLDGTTMSFMVGETTLDAGEISAISE